MNATENDTYPVREIFYSLQGEGFHTGTAAVFVRFAGCNLSCDFCDTDHTSDVTPMTAAEIAASVNSYPATHVVLTGGEPALRIDRRLCTALRDRPSRYIQIETNGTLALGSDLQIDWVTCSPKTQSRVLTRVDELKVVMLPDPKFDPELYAALYPEARVRFLQPCSCGNTAETVAYILAHPEWRLSLQTHKYIGIE